MFFEDMQRKGIKIYREHTIDVDLDSKNVQRGGVVTDQNDRTGIYTYESIGDECSWVYWNADESRPFGAWAQTWFVIVAGTGDLLYPVDTTAFTADMSFLPKTLTHVATMGDNYLVRTVDHIYPNVGEFGLVFQTVNQDYYELVFISTKQKLLCDNVNISNNQSTLVYAVKGDLLPDLTNYGDLDDVFEIVSKRLEIKTDSHFYQNVGLAINSGPLSFKQGTPPVGASEVGLYFSGGAYKWYGNSILCADQTGTASSHVLGAALGVPDPANVGHLDQVLTVNSSHLAIDTIAHFFYNTAKDGPLNFQYSAAPTITITTASDYAEAKPYFIGGVWKFITPTGAGSSVILARVRWNFDDAADLSEGEIVTYNIFTHSFLPTGVLVWIDRNLSRSCKFETAGDDTIFVIALHIPIYDRNGVIRDLYTCESCHDDEGFKIANFRKVGGAYSLQNELKVVCHRDERNLNSWDNVYLTTIRTKIKGSPFDNVMLTRIPWEWKVEFGNWNWTEVSDFSRGMPIFSRPISPALVEPIDKLWESSYSVANASLATYGRIL